MKKSLVFTALLVAVAFMPASATIINLPADQQNIQAAINISSHDHQQQHNRKFSLFDVRSIWTDEGFELKDGFG